MFGNGSESFVNGNRNIFLTEQTIIKSQFFLNHSHNLRVPSYLNYIGVTRDENGWHFMQLTCTKSISRHANHGQVTGTGASQLVSVSSTWLLVTRSVEYVDGQFYNNNNHLTSMESQDHSQYKLQLIYKIN